jgi:hypothetical protein
LLPAFASIAHAQTPEVDLPLGVGFHVPSYDRVNGLSLPFGPSIIFGDDRLVIDPQITYRSHLGNFDPSLAVKLQFDTIFSVDVRGERGTFSNDDWIRSDLMNSIWALGFGRDARNYFRADRAHAYVGAHLQGGGLDVQLHAGPQFENDWSTGWRPTETDQGPFSLFYPHDTENGINRANPLIDPGHITSGILGVTLTYQGEHLLNHSRAMLEVGRHTPSDSKFQQVTFNEESFVPTLWGQGLQLDAHFVTTSGDPTPAQRYVYLGGSGTLATIDLLSLGGDRMYFVDAWYRIPLHFFALPMVGHPYIAPRFASGAVGTRSFGTPTQNVGVRIGLGTLHLDYLVNPRTHEDVFVGGLSLPR